MPFWAAAAISVLNFIYGWFVLPESLAPDNRRKFELARANPFGAFKVFATYRGVLPMVLVLGAFFFSTSVYPAIWPFWGIAKFGWAEAMVGATLAVFGLIAAAFQGAVRPGGGAVRRMAGGAVWPGLRRRWWSWAMGLSGPWRRCSR